MQKRAVKTVNSKNYNKNNNRVNANKKTDLSKKQLARSSKKKHINNIQANSQLFAVLLFATSILVLFIILVEGTNLWQLMHEAIFGLFGATSYAIPIIFTYISIIITNEKGNVSVKYKMIQALILIILISSAIQVFSMSSIPGESFTGKLSALYQDGILVNGGGVVSGLLAWPLISIFGIVGARIIILIMIFIFIMVLTGTTLLGLFKIFSAPVRVIEKRYTEKINKEKPEIDISLGPHLPTHPVYSPKNSIDIPLADTNVQSNYNNFEKQKQDIVNAQSKDYEVTGSIKKIKLNNSDTDNREKDNLEIDSLVKKITQLDNKKVEHKLDIKDAKQDFAREIKQNIVDSVSDNPNDGLKEYRFPSLAFLNNPKIERNLDVSQELKINAELLVDTLKSFGVQTRVIDISRGPSVTRYELQPSAGVKISKITNLSDDIALNLATAGVRIEAPIPNKPAVGIEVPNRKVDIVTLKEIIDSKDFLTAKSKLTVCLGKNIAGNLALADLSVMPHTLIAGSTGSGKSVCINSIIVSLLYKASPDEVKLLMIDPKVVELGIYNGIPHLLVPVVTDPRKAAGALNWAVTEMLNRYKLFADNGVRDLKGYNRFVKGKDGMNPMPQIVIIIDELADLMMAAPNEVEDAICRLAQMARAAGMHLVIATQRPSVDVITGVIKANIPSRIAFAVSSQVDSRTILDGAGAEKLLGRGDMLFSPVGSSKPVRVQGCFVSDSEVEQIVSFIKNKDIAEYDEEIIEEIEKQSVITKNNSKSESKGESFIDSDEMISAAIECLIESGQASTSYLQRKLKLGYSRAARIIDQLEEHGIVGPYEGGKRQVMITKQQWHELNNNKQKI